MAVDIYLQNEKGSKLDQLIDLSNPLYKILENYDIYHLDGFCLFKGIDLYGDTYFNEIQMKTLKIECEKLKEIIKEKDLIEFLNKLIVLIDKGLDGGPNYLKFVGD